MIASRVKFKGHRCFTKEFTGFDELKPINVLIGRNNSGKSHMIDFAEKLVGSVLVAGWEGQFDGAFSEAELKRQFSPNTIGGDLSGNHWEQHGRSFVDVPLRFTFGADQQIKTVDLAPGSNLNPTDLSAGRITKLRELARQVQGALTGRQFRRLNAERNIRPEPPDVNNSLAPDGSGATNVIRRYFHSASLPRELIQVELLKSLTEIFGQDGPFTEIQVRLHDVNDNSGQPQGTYEVYLGEKQKGLVELSRSGSGLKTVILVLLYLLVIPHMTGVPKGQLAFGLEELENNLHPALLRRLFRYLEFYAVHEGAIFFLTTHSSVALDVFGMSKDAQIIYVTHDGTYATARPVSTSVERLGIVSELGAKPSDLLQANGVIWVEGPSDRIHVNRWIEVLSNGRFREGRDYQCAFYGGALLANLQFRPVEDEVRELVNLIRLNPNVVLICDSDRVSEDSPLKQRVERLASEVKGFPDARVWVTDAKEIENYLPGVILGKVYSLENVPDPGKYERFFPPSDTKSGGISFVETHLHRKTIDKVELALRAGPYITAELMRPRFDWEPNVDAIVKRIEEWNK